jgi:hypothetical protein
MTQLNSAGKDVYRKLAKKQRSVLAESIKRESVSKQRRILEDYDRLIANNISVLTKENLFENWEAYCFHSTSAEFIAEMSDDNKSSDVILNEKVSPEAVNFFTGGLKTQAQYLNNVEDYLDKVMAVASQGNFPVLQAGLEKAKAEVEGVSQELEGFHAKASGGKGFLGKLTTMPQRFLSRLGAGSTKDYQLEEAFIDGLVGKSLLEQKGSLGLLMSMLDESLIAESKTLLTEVVDPVSMATGMSSMGQLVGEIGKISAQHGGNLLTRVDIGALVRAHPDIQRSTLENIVHLMGKNAQNVAGDPSQITPDLFQSVGRAMGWLPNNAAATSAPPIPGVPTSPDGGGSFLAWLHKLWIKAMAYAKGVYAKMYAYLAPKLLAIKAWLLSTFKGGVAAAKGLLGKAGSWLGSKWAALKGGLAAKGGIAGLAGKGLAGLKAGMAGLGAAAMSPAAAGLAAVGGAAVAGKSLYSLMARRKKLENVFDFVNSLKNIANASLKESINLISESEIFSELFEADEPTGTEKPAKDVSQMVKLYTATMKKYVDMDQLAAELDTEEGHNLLRKIKSIPSPKVPTERYA